MNKKIIGKVISGAAIAASLLTSGAGLALAQNADSTLNGTNAAITATTTSGAGATTNSTDATATSGPAVPGIPNTGAGGDSGTNLLILGVTAFVVVVGGLYLLGRRTPAQAE